LKTLRLTSKMAPKEGKGKGGGKASAKKKPALTTKAKQVAQVANDTKLAATDDERTTMSKKISWILRKGAERIQVEIDPEGWVKLSDLMAQDLLDMPDKTEDKLKSIIDESNAQKLRYETKEGPDGMLIRALTKKERKTKDEPETVSIAPAETTKTLRGDAPAFVPGQSAAAAPMSPTANPYAAMGYGFPFAGYPWPYGFPGMAQAGAAGGAGQKFQGRIKSFNQEKGYGFIDSSDAHRIYGRDVFLHKAHVGELQVHSIVSFSVEMNKEGMPQARDVQAVEGGKAKAKSKGKGKGAGQPKAKAKKEKKPKEGDGAEALPPGEVDAAPAAETPAES